MSDRSARSQEGAALLIVLLLVATLSFIVLSISDRMILASSRTANMRVRAELLWRMVGAETLARAALEAAVKTEGFKFTPDNPFFETPREVPMEGGGALISFRDATGCFNLNAFAKEQSGQRAAAPLLAELEQILGAAALENANAPRLAATIADWIDKDDFETAQGAEDGYYAGLPAPYRTPGGAISDISELRAMAGVGADEFIAIAPLLCALPGFEPAPLNINMLTPDDAALLVGLAGEDVSLAAAGAAIENRPKGGYASAEQFWSDAAFAGKQIADEARERVKLNSQYVEADVAIRFADQTAALTLLFELSENGEARLVSRRIAPVRQ